MSDPDTIATYEAVADEYRERHGDRDDVAELVEAFLAAVDGDGGRAGHEADGGTHILDLGCGPGWESATFAEAGYEVLGLDLTAAFLDAATETAPDADFARMDMRRLGLAEGVAHGLWACASFLHVPREEAPATLDGFVRALADGGVLALNVKRGEGTRAGDAYDGDDREFVLYEPAELRSLVERAGFDVEIMQSQDGWIFLLARA